MTNIKMVCSYDGTTYSGFQKQPHGNTIQNVIEAAIESLTKQETKIIGSGRTDAGVHARAQVFNFHTTSSIPVERWALALNSKLPNDIVIRTAVQVDDDFHARFSAKMKTYRYSIDTNQFPDVFKRYYSFHHYAPLNVEKMRIALPYFMGEHDFTSFCSMDSDQLSHVRTVYDIQLHEVEGGIDLYVTGNGFLYNMVRIIAGTLMAIGEETIDPHSVPHIIQSRDRRQAGPTAMAHGLTLWEVKYT